MDKRETLDLFQEVDTKEKAEIDINDHRTFDEDILGDDGDQRSDKNTNKRQHIVREILSYIFIILLAYVIASVITKYVLTIVTVEQSSMEPTLNEGDYLVLWRLGEIDRFDIVVFEDPREEGSYLIKRLIGIPGDHVSLQDGILYLNGEPLVEDYTKDPFQYKNDYTMEDICFISGLNCLTEGEAKIPDGYYFVLGDNRNNSIDSDDRQIGLVKKELFEGRIIFRLKGGFGRLK